MTAVRHSGLAQWTILLAGPLTWFTHFCLVYAAASLELTYAPAAGPASRLAIAGLTLAALALVALSAIRAAAVSPGARGSPYHRFWTAAVRLMCLLSAVAIVWQALPAALVA